jgi:hypothetical protein
VGFNPKESLADGGEDGRLSDGVGVEVVQLHPVVVRQGPHEATRQNPEAPFMERGKANDVPCGQTQHLLIVRRDLLGLRAGGLVPEQAAVNQHFQIYIANGRHRPRVAGRKDGDLFLHRNEQKPKSSLGGT